MAACASIADSVDSRSRPTRFPTSAPPRQYDSGSETLFDKFDYSYFADGSRASETRTNADGTTTIEWTYDGLNRLIEEEFSGYDGQGDALAYTDTYSFDLASNRTKLVHDDTTSGGGGSAGPDSTTTYEYDANDRLLAETKDVAGGSTADRAAISLVSSRLTDALS